MSLDSLRKIHYKIRVLPRSTGIQYYILYLQRNKFRESFRHTPEIHWCMYVCMTCSTVITQDVYIGFTSKAMPNPFCYSKKGLNVYVTLTNVHKEQIVVSDYLLIGFDNDLITA